MLETAAKTATVKLGYLGLKPEELSMVIEFLSGRNAFAVLPILDLARLSAMESFFLLLMS